MTNEEEGVGGGAGAVDGSGDGVDPGSSAGATGADPGGPEADELVILSAFERMSPQGTPDWALTDSLRRLSQPTAGVAASAPWTGLPDDLWERGRAAKAGQRMMGDVIAELADLMDRHARHILEAGDKELRDRLVAAWDAARYLAARLEVLESRVDPTDDLLIDPGLLVEAPDLSVWADAAPSWFGDANGDRPILVGESAPSLAASLRAAGHRVREVEPNGSQAWDSLGSDPAGEVVLGGLVETVDGLDRTELAGAVLAGVTDRFDLAAQLSLVRQTLRAVQPSGSLVVLVTDRVAWNGRLTAIGRDLVRGHPLHPETWLVLLDRLGIVDPIWHRPASGDVHAVVGTVAS